MKRLNTLILITIAILLLAWSHSKQDLVHRSGGFEGSWNSRINYLVIQFCYMIETVYFIH